MAGGAGEDMAVGVREVIRGTPTAVESVGRGAIGAIEAIGVIEAKGDLP